MKKVKAKIIRNVTELAIVTVGDDGCVDEVLEILDELDFEDVEVVSVHDILSEW